MMRTLACGLLLMSCAHVELRRAPELTAFECTRNISGKRTNGVERVRFEPASDRATLTLEFTSPQQGCGYSARWRFPESFPPWGASPEERRGLRSCVASPLSLFAVSCQLFEHQLQSSAYAMRSELQVRASGPAADRTIGFSILWPSDALETVPAPGCDAVFIENARVTRLEPTQFSFDEADCHEVR